MRRLTVSKENLREFNLPPAPILKFPRSMTDRFAGLQQTVDEFNAEQKRVRDNTQELLQQWLLALREGRS